MKAKEAALVLNVSRSYIYKLMDIGEIAYEKRGRHRLPVDASVAEYKARNLVPASPKEHKPVKGPAHQYKHLFTKKPPKNDGG
jgi:excisionase family DNA binding protein